MGKRKQVVNCAIEPAPTEFYALKDYRIRKTRQYPESDSADYECVFWERFWARVDKVDAGCWLWTAGKYHDGYGRVRHRNIQTRAHRLVYTEYVGELREGQLACHACDVRHCVNPDHLFAGTAKDNHEDAVQKGRVVPINLMPGLRRAATKPSCVRGHSLIDEANVYRYGNRRMCRTCNRENQAARARMSRTI